MAKARTPPDAAEVADGLRDRVVEFRRVPSAELNDNEANWRVHPYAQQAALGELLDSVGIAGVLTAYYSERNDGKLTLIDGHERRGHQADWPTVILDVSDEEADLLLLTLDPLAGMANSSPADLEALLATTHAGTAALEDLLQTLGAEAATGANSDDGDEDSDVVGSRPMGMDPDVAPGMGLSPFEHYDYVVILARSTHDWLALQDMLSLEPVEFRLRDGRRRFGRGRVVEAQTVIERLRARA